MMALCPGTRLSIVQHICKSVNLDWSSMLDFSTPSQPRKSRQPNASALEYSARKTGTLELYLRHVTDGMRSLQISNIGVKTLLAVLPVWLSTQARYNENVNSGAPSFLWKGDLHLHVTQFSWNQCSCGFGLVNCALFFMLFPTLCCTSFLTETANQWRQTSSLRFSAFQRQCRAL